MSADATKMEKIVSLCKRRGFIFQSSEIYGGIGGFWDYGPLGVELKRNIKEAWWNDMVRNPPTGPSGRDLQMVGVDCSIIMNPKVWEASGHATGFADPMIDDRETKQRFRADQLIGLWKIKEIPKSEFSGLENQNIFEFSVSPPEFTSVAISVREAAEEFEKILRKERKQGVFEYRWIKQVSYLGGEVALMAAAPKREQQETICLWYARKIMLDELTSQADLIPSPYTGKIGNLTQPRQFNLMFKTHYGAMEDASSLAYLRPETAQGIFANFKNVCDSSRVKIPFGIAQVGKSFRNEINPRNYTFRSREFEQMEIEFFCHEKDSMMWWEWWRNVRINWYKTLGLKSENLRPRNQDEKELAHYSKACTDIEYMFPFSDEPQELEGVAHRGCFDLTQHQTHSGKDMSYFDDESKERFTPTVIEPSAGADRSTLAFICEAYTVDESRPSPEIMRFHPRLAPIKAAVFPLVNKEGMPEIAEQIYRDLRKHYACQYDPKQSIGKRYARMDEAGTPFCFTVDGQTLQDGTVTVRDRDTGQQERIDKGNCLLFLREKLNLE
ncbi:MAG: Proline--tRNA ligase [Phycisphaerae bacterium]|nr:Proline--tRNA ligase [Phycisphaerae bacterium]